MDTTNPFNPQQLNTQTEQPNPRSLHPLLQQQLAQITAPQPTPGFQGSDGMAAFGQNQRAMQNDNNAFKLRELHDMQSGQHLGIGGTPILANGREAGNAFDNGTFSPTAPSSFGLTPEARLASQGSSATNQIAMQGGIQGINPTKLNRMNGAYAAGHQSAQNVTGGLMHPNVGQVVPGSATYTPDMSFGVGSTVANDQGGKNLYTGVAQEGANPTDQYGKPFPIGAAITGFSRTSPQPQIPSPFAPSQPGRVYGW